MLFAYQQLGVEPDIMTLGKGIGGSVRHGPIRCVSYRH